MPMRKKKYPQLGCVLRLKLHGQIFNSYWAYFHIWMWPKEINTKCACQCAFLFGLHIYSVYLSRATKKPNWFTFINGCLMTEILLGLGSAWGPVEFGYPMACAQCWGDVLCFLFTGPDPPARTSAPSEICKGRTGHDQVRRNKSESSPLRPTETTVWCLLKSLAVDWTQSILYVWLCSACVYMRGVDCMFFRDDVLQSLTIVQHCILGAGGLMPPLKGEPIPELWAVAFIH